jgi:hypothetical protein
MQVIEAQCFRSWRLTITLHINQIRTSQGLWEEVSGLARWGMRRACVRVTGGRCCDRAEWPAAGLLGGRRGLQARKSRSGGRPSSEVSRAGTDGVRIRPWAGP